MTAYVWAISPYEERVREIEHGSFSPLVFSTAGGMGPIATTVYKRIASLIADKRQEPYSTINGQDGVGNLT